MKPMQSTYDSEERIFEAVKQDGTSKIYHVSDKPLGSGNYGTVYKAISQTGERVILKVSDQSLEEVKKEVASFNQLYSPTDIDPIATLDDGRHISIIPRIDGQKALNLTGWGVLEASISHMMSILARFYSQLLQLHSQNIIHGDIKLENTLLTNFDSYSNTNYSVPVFSLVNLERATTVELGESKFTGLRATSDAIAPEVANRGYAYFASDIYASTGLLGLLVGENKQVFQKDSLKDNIEPLLESMNDDVKLKMAILRQKIPRDISIKSIDFPEIFQLMRDPEPYARPTASELVILFNALQNYYATAETLARYTVAKNAGEDISLAISKSQLRDKDTIKRILKESPPYHVRSQYVEVYLREEIDLFTDALMGELQTFSNRSKRQNIPEIKKRLEEILGKNLSDHVRAKKIRSYIEIAQMLSGQGMAINRSNFEKEFRKILELKINSAIKFSDLRKGAKKYNQVIDRLASKLEDKSSREIFNAMPTDTGSHLISTAQMDAQYLESLETQLDDGWKLIEKLQSDLKNKVARDGLERVLYEHENHDQMATVAAYKIEMVELQGNLASGSLMSNFRQRRQKELEDRCRTALKEQGVFLSDTYTLDDYVHDLESCVPIKYNDWCVGKVEHERRFHKRILEAKPISSDTVPGQNKQGDVSSFSFKKAVACHDQDEERLEHFEEYETPILNQIIEDIEDCLGKGTFKNLFTQQDQKNLSYEEKFAKLKNKSKEIFQTLLGNMKETKIKGFEKFKVDSLPGMGELLAQYEELAGAKKNSEDVKKAYESVKKVRQKHTNVRTNRIRKGAYSLFQEPNWKWELDVREKVLLNLFDNILNGVKMKYEANVGEVFDDFKVGDVVQFNKELKSVQDSSRKRLDELQIMQGVLKAPEKPRQDLTQKQEVPFALREESQPRKSQFLPGG